MRLSKTNFAEIIENNYQIGKVNLVKRIDSGVSNKNYLVGTDGGQYVLRVADGNITNQLDNMIPFMEYASSKDFPCPRIIKLKNKEDYLIYHREMLLLMSYEAGKQLSPELVNGSKIESFGKTMATLHSLDWRPQKSTRALTFSHIIRIYKTYLPKIKDSNFRGNDEFIKRMAKEFTTLNDMMPTVLAQLPKGVVHNDPTPWNVLFVGNKLSSLVDFENVGYSEMLQDIARAINTWCFHKDRLDDSLFTRFMIGYQKGRKLTSIEMDNLSLLLRYIAFRHCAYFMRMYIKRKHNNPTDSIDYHCLKYYQDHKPLSAIS